MKRVCSVLIALCVVLAAAAQKVTVEAFDEPAAEVFRSIMEQTDMNFVYSTELLDSVRVTVSAHRLPLKKVLARMFRGTGISYKVKGRNVVLKRRHDARRVERLAAPEARFYAVPSTPDAQMLKEVVVVSRLDAPAVETAEMGAAKITAADVISAPALLGESDVIKALHMQPGVAEGTEGLAGMHVHGGGADENLCMLDNVPLYNVNHFAGLFSAFNTDIIRYIDFFKSSVPAKYDGRLSSVMDVRLRDGGTEGYHGSARLGLTSGAFNIGGPAGSRTTWIVGLRRSWFDLLSVPMLALINSGEDEKTRFHYYFMDLNAGLKHRFSDRATGFVSAYFGDDMLRTGSKDASGADYDWKDDDKYDFHWGNLVVRAGLNYRLTDAMTAEFTAAYTRFFSMMKHDDVTEYAPSTGQSDTHLWMKTDNNINDWIFRSDFDWQASENSRVRFGASYVRHSFLPARSRQIYTEGEARMEISDSTRSYGANELNAYVEDDWSIGGFRINAGLHLSLFNIDGRVKHGISPRLSLNRRLSDRVAVKAAYTRTVQYVHQLTQSYLALPTDQWIPVAGDFKPQTADKVAAGVYARTPDGAFILDVEGYCKWMHNLVDYCDEYYLRPPLEVWDARLTSGRGTAKGIDVKLEKHTGNLTGHIAYSLAWADRTFAGKNGGRTYPARFDNRHTINVLLSWHVSPKVQLNAAWTGHSGNRFTLLTQTWEQPPYGTPADYADTAPLQAPLNNYRLPFYHRLDLSCMVQNRRGYWTFGLYNAYNHHNVVAVRRTYTNTYPCAPVFQKVSLLPVMPSISYTWQF